MSKPKTITNEKLCDLLMDNMSVAQWMQALPQLEDMFYDNLNDYMSYLEDEALVDIAKDFKLIPKDTKVK